MSSVKMQDGPKTSAINLEQGPILSTMVTVEQLVDLSIGTPEVGAINLNVLHSLLHVIIQQMNIQRCLVEFKGYDAERMEGIIQSARPGPILKLSEYVIDITDGKSVKSFKSASEFPSPRVRKPGTGGSAYADTEHGSSTAVTEKKRGKGSGRKVSYDEDEEYDDEPRREDKKRSSKKTKIKDEEKPEKEEKVEKEEKKDEPEKKDDKKGKKDKKKKPCPCESDSMYDKKGRKIGGEDGGDETDGTDKSKSTTYYGSEGEGLQTIVLVENVAQPCDDWRERPALSHESINRLEERVVRIQEAFELLEGLPANEDLIKRTMSGDKPYTPIADMWQLFNLHKRMEAAEGGINKLASMMEDILRDHESFQKAMTLIAEFLDPGTDEDGDEFSRMSSREKFMYLKNMLDKLMADMALLCGGLSIEEIAAKLASLPDADLLKYIMDRFMEIDRDFTALLNAFGDCGFEEFLRKLRILCEEMDNILAAVQLLHADKAAREMELNVLREEIEFLKTTKADKEVMEEELAEKADNKVVNQKVNKDTFNAACEDLTKGLEDALERVAAMELALQKAIEDLRKELENKLDKMEIQALKDFINQKLKCLQDKLKALAAMRKCIEAAGAKSRYLRDVNCISCDKDVVMKRENEVTATAPALTATRSMRPYLTYELDQARKAMKIPQQRNLNHFEDATKDQEKRPLHGLPALPCPGAAEAQLSKLEHLCNRYCGGSHTITTPQQRVTRIGHFLTEYGPQAISLMQESTKEGDKKSTQATSGTSTGPPANSQSSK